jgi:phage gpG-like protein
MTAISLEVKGLKELQKKLTKEAMLQPFNEGVKKITLALQREVTVATPVITGRLRASITPKVTEANGIFQGLVGTNVQYSTFVEYGHSQTPGRFVPAIGKRLVASSVPARHVTEGSGIRIKGIGMFAYGLEKIKAKMAEYLHEIGAVIEQRWNK